jgi:hypothetical protein
LIMDDRAIPPFPMASGLAVGAVLAAAQTGMVAVAFGAPIGRCGLPVGASAMARAVLTGMPKAARPCPWPRRRRL